MFEPVEGIDYLVNYYALLEVEPKSPAKEIKAALKKKKAGVHPDRLIHVDEALQAEAKTKYRAYERAGLVLLDEEKRSSYDKKLEEFILHRPQHISLSGHAILDMNVQKIDVKYILSDQELDIEPKNVQAKKLIQYDEKRLESAENLYQRYTDDSTRLLYSAELGNYLIYLEVKEKHLWVQAGVLNPDLGSMQDLQYPDEYEERTKLQLTSFGEKVAHAYEEHHKCALLGISTIPLLLEGAVEGEKELQKIEDQKLKVKERFHERTESLLLLAKEKSLVLEKLLSLTTYEFVNEQKVNSDRFELYLYSSSQDRILLKFVGQKSTQALSLKHVYMEPYRKDQLREKKQRATHDVLLINHNENIAHMMLEPLYVAELLLASE